MCFMLWESRMEKSILMAGLRISPIQKLLWILRMNFQGKQIYLDSRKVRMQLERLFAEYVTESQAQYVETADIKAVLDSLKQRNIWIGLATADTVPSAKTV